MIEVRFQDREPVYPGRVTLVPVTGQKNTYDMTRADRPSVVGTPLNKTNIESIVHSRLTGRFYVPEVTRSVVASVGSIPVNPIPTAGWIQTSNGYTSGGYTATSNAPDTAVQAFDGDDTTAWISGDATEPWIALELADALTVKVIRLCFASENGAVCTVQGSNDGQPWEDLLTIAEAPSKPTEYALTTIGSYQRYRLTFDQGGISLFTWEFRLCDSLAYENTFTVSNGYPDTWDIGQRTCIAIPSDVSALSVAFNTLNGIAVDTILQPNKCYELRYTGSAFAAREV